ncbi:MAG: hypothetical protein ACKVE3_03905 [Dissulfuribacterales bacterium]
MKALLALADGTVFRGRSFTGRCETNGRTGAWSIRAWILINSSGLTNLARGV